jgi:hypothetical protein
MKIDFAMIDAKDCELVGVGYTRPANVHNAKVIAAAEVEYLNRLLALQEEIKAKYEPRLIENNPIEGEPKAWDEGSPGDVHEEEMKGKLEKGTGALWYS